jgi:pyrroline-5-carboxylate reductase
MGSAIAERIKDKYAVAVFDKDTKKTVGLSGIEAAVNIADLVKSADAVILAVKPQDFGNLLSEIRDFLENKLIISIAAGITTAYIEKKLDAARVIRTMPNLPAKIGKGMICLCKGRLADNKDLIFTEKLFTPLGKTLVLNEDMMDAATAVSGSGPAYVCEYLESGKSKQAFLNDFRSAAKAIGFRPQEAALLVNTTFSGTIAFLKKTKLLPLELKNQVASKGGTTEAALEVLHKGGPLSEAIKAALRRAKELSRR